LSTRSTRTPSWCRLWHTTQRRTGCARPVSMALSKPGQLRPQKINGNKRSADLHVTTVGMHKQRPCDHACRYISFLPIPRLAIFPPPSSPNPLSSLFSQCTWYLSHRPRPLLLTSNSRTCLPCQTRCSHEPTHLHNGHAQAS